MAGNPTPGGNRNTEPVLTAGGITAAVGAVLNVLLVFKMIPLDADPETAQMQVAALNAVIMPLVGILLAVWARKRVTPV